MRPCRRGERHRRHRIPQHIHAEWYADLAAQLADDHRHGCGGGGVDLEFIRPVILIAEHHRIDAGLLQRMQILAAAFEQSCDSRLRVIKRRTRQGTEMHHRDHGLG